MAQVLPSYFIMFHDDGTFCSKGAIAGQVEPEYYLVNVHDDDGNTVSQAIRHIDELTEYFFYPSREAMEVSLQKLSSE